MRKICVFALLTAAVCAADIDPLVAKLSIKKDQDAAQRQLRAMRRTALPHLAAHLERATDPDVKRRLREILAPRHLKPQGDVKLLETLGLARTMQPVLDRYLDGDTAADERLAKAAPYAAVVVKARLEAEKDAQKRVRLRIAYYRMLHDTPAHADSIFQAAQGLHTVARNHGPFKDKWRSAEVRKLRARGKVLHWCFVNPRHYGRSLERNLGMYAPYRDLPAARGLYQLAQRMYEELAKEEQDKGKAAELTWKAAKAATAAAACGRAAPRTKG